MRERLSTENLNERISPLEQLSTHEFLTIMNQENQKTVEAIEHEMNSISNAISLILTQLKAGGRLFYVGTGASGRLALIDALECQSSYGIHPNLVHSLIAGGDMAFIQTIDDVEDKMNLGREDLINHKLTKNDVVVGITTNGQTPYVVGALKYANTLGAKTISISSHRCSLVSEYAHVAIEVETGPEVISGATYLKAGSAQKMILDLLSTGSMIKLGKTYQNLLIDLKPTNKKLREEAKQIIITLTHCSEQIADETLQAANYHPKIAIIMIVCQCSKQEAKQKLMKTGGLLAPYLNPISE